jgi:2-dehydropantoate 2-reductase
MDMKWSKMLTNLLANATSAILDLSPAEIFIDKRLNRLEVGQLREAIQVMHAQGIEVVDLPGTPVRALAFAVQHLPLEITRRFLVNAVGSGRGGKMPSLHIDLHSGRGKSEVDYLNGAVVRFGKRCGVPTPVNHLLNDTLLELMRGVSPIDRYTNKSEELLNKLQPD